MHPQILAEPPSHFAFYLHFLAEPRSGMRICNVNKKILIELKLVNFKSEAKSKKNDTNKCLETMQKVRFEIDFGMLYELQVRSFVSFAQLNFECIENKNHTISKISIIPAKLLIIDRPLIFKFNLNMLVDIVLLNIKGLDLKSSIFKDVFKQNNLQFYYSELSAYQNGTKIVNCLARSNFKMFLNSKSIIFSNTVKYNKNTCPFIFGHLNLDLLEFRGITGTFYKNNQLAFVDHNFSHNLKLSTKLLNKNLFGMVENLQISGKLRSIDRNVFGHLENLRSLRLDLENFFDILALDKNGFSNLIKKNCSFYFSFLSLEYYNFPDEDFCYFEAFHGKSLINPVFIKQKRCSCTKIWILHEKMSINCHNLTRQECNFTQMKKKCNKLFRKKTTATKIDAFYTSELISFINLTFFPKSTSEDRA
ncbi:hypothetical protein BpHYR1_054259 [Brachionus plicatilis]|uniref:Uncharacterized protein n=1 Tax=Brachionus plicatilis TaxID=10195 RepID=A0A3M7T2H4_BRAPC|nr:hypothetical protein BpHYR1_054259 [Brachionus plicatilis]